MIGVLMDESVDQNETNHLTHYLKNNIDNRLFIRYLRWRLIDSPFTVHRLGCN